MHVNCKHCGNLVRLDDNEENFKYFQCDNPKCGRISPIDENM